MVTRLVGLDEDEDEDEDGIEEVSIAVERKDGKKNQRCIERRMMLSGAKSALYHIRIAIG